MKRALLLGAAGFLFAATGASAMPLAPQETAVVNADVQNVRLVCNGRGRCWRTGPRYGRGYYGGYDGGPYAYGPRAYVGPGYGYGYGGGPSIGFSFGGGRW